MQTVKLALSNKLEWATTVQLAIEYHFKKKQSMKKTSKKRKIYAN